MACFLHPAVLITCGPSRIFTLIGLGNGCTDTPAIRLLHFSGLFSYLLEEQERIHCIQVKHGGRRSSAFSSSACGGVLWRRSLLHKMGCPMASRLQRLYFEITNVRSGSQLILFFTSVLKTLRWTAILSGISSLRALSLFPTYLQISR